MKELFLINSLGSEKLHRLSTRLLCGTWCTECNKNLLVYLAVDNAPSAEFVVAGAITAAAVAVVAAVDKHKAHLFNTISNESL